MISFGGKYLGAHFFEFARLLLDITGMGNPLHFFGNFDSEKFQKGGQQIDPAEELVIAKWFGRAAAGRAHDQGDTGTGVIQGGFGAWQRRTVVGHEDHPGVLVQARLGQYLQ
ncbi:Uncharacterised protein [Mycobacteroides abscessus subsp. abscessus]|nr:Uncharacterised protein [Mycobacteroides abscessus subsp. abscessus]